jgi:ATP-dependent phosphoenolpyruvate carboxykinase
MTLTMPTAVSNTNRYSIKNKGVNTVTVAFDGTETGDGSTTLSLQPNASVDLISDDSNFFIL